MDDRELLELAARAAGYDYKPQNGAIVVGGIPANWNPLTDDGDALRLAVRLSLMLDTDYNGCAAVGSAALCEMIEQHNGEPYAATRRAIVRAAAQIGKVANE